MALSTLLNFITISTQHFYLFFYNFNLHCFFLKFLLYDSFNYYYYYLQNYCYFVPGTIKNYEFFKKYFMKIIVKKNHLIIINFILISSY